MSNHARQERRYVKAERYERRCLKLGATHTLKWPALPRAKNGCICKCHIYHGIRHISMCCHD